jgi:hypothetical protein
MKLKEIYDKIRLYHRLMQRGREMALQNHMVRLFYLIQEFL